MTQPQRQLLSLWDYGWLDHHQIVVASYNNSQELIDAYFNSECFGTSFVGPRLDEVPEIHGPFWRASIASSDFQIVTPAEFWEQIRFIKQPEGFPEPADKKQWRAVEEFVSELERRYTWLIRLRLTEDDSDKFHDWGYVLTIFREYLLANPNSRDVTRLVFGYD